MMEPRIAKPQKILPDVEEFGRWGHPWRLVFSQNELIMGTDEFRTNNKVPFRNVNSWLWFIERL